MDVSPSRALDGETQLLVNIFRRLKKKPKESSGEVSVREKVGWEPAKWMDELRGVSRSRKRPLYDGGQRM